LFNYTALKATLLLSQFTPSKTFGLLNAANIYLNPPLNCVSLDSLG
jgi:hypothetical protein